MDEKIKQFNAELFRLKRLMLGLECTDLLQDRCRPDILIACMNFHLSASPTINWRNEPVDNLDVYLLNGFEMVKKLIQKDIKILKKIIKERENNNGQ